MIHSVSGVSFSLRGDSIPTDGSGRILITDINPSGDSNRDALICQSDVPSNNDGATLGISDWILHPTQLSTNSSIRIVGSNDRGWTRNRDLDSDGHQLVRLRRVSNRALEGVFTCNIAGDINTPRFVGIYYSSEFYKKPL